MKRFTKNLYKAYQTANVQVGAVQDALFELLAAPNTDMRLAKRVRKDLERLSVVRDKLLTAYLEAHYG